MSDVEINASGELSFADAMREYHARQTSEETETPADAPTEAAADEQEQVTKEAGTAEEPATSEDHDEPEQDGKPPKQSNLEKRFSKLTKTIRELEQKSGRDADDAARWREHLEKTSKPAPTAEAKPAADDAKFYEPREGETQLDYDRRIIRHETQQALKAERDAEAKATKEAEQRKSQETAAKAWQERESAAKTQFEDYDEALEDFAAAAKTGKAGLTPHMEAFITDSEHGAKVLYHLATNLNEASEIAKLGPAAAARKLTAIEAQFVEKNDSTEEKKPPVTTKAPPPAKPVGKTSPAPRTFDASSEELANSMSADEWARKRNAEQRKKGRLY